MVPLLTIANSKATLRQLALLPCLESTLHLKVLTFKPKFLRRAGLSALELLSAENRMKRLSSLPRGPSAPFLVSISCRNPLARTPKSCDCFPSTRVIVVGLERALNDPYLKPALSFPDIITSVFSRSASWDRRKPRWIVRETSLWSRLALHSHFSPRYLFAVSDVR